MIRTDLIKRQSTHLTGNVLHVPQGPTRVRRHLDAAFGLATLVSTMKRRAARDLRQLRPLEPSLGQVTVSLALKASQEHAVGIRDHIEAVLRVALAAEVAATFASGKRRRARSATSSSKRSGLSSATGSSVARGRTGRRTPSCESERGPNPAAANSAGGSSSSNSAIWTTTSRTADETFHGSQRLTVCWVALTEQPA